MPELKTYRDSKESNQVQFANIMLNVYMKLTFHDSDVQCITLNIPVILISVTPVVKFPHDVQGIVTVATGSEAVIPIELDPPQPESANTGDEINPLLPHKVVKCQLQIQTAWLLPSQTEGKQKEQEL